MPAAENRADPALDLIDRLVRPIALYLGGAAMCALGLLTVIAVGFRYFLNAPIHGAADIAQIFLLACVTFSIAQSGRTGGQVAVEILGTLAGPQLTRWTDVVVKLLGAAAMAVLTYQLIMNGLSAADYGEASNTLVIPWGPFYYTLAFGMALYGVVLLFEALVHLKGGEVRHEAGSVDDM